MLRKCEKCHREFAISYDLTCPFCGKKQNSKFNKLLLVSLILIVMITIYHWIQ